MSHAETLPLIPADPADPTTMTAAPHNVTLSARVPATLRAGVAAAALEGEDQSATVRRLLTLGLDAQRRAAEALAAPRAKRTPATPTETAAANRKAPRPGTARHLALRYFVRRHERGATADEVHALLMPAPQNSIARRVTDLLEGGMIEPVRWTESIDGAGHPFARAGRYGTRYLGPDEDRLGDVVARKTRAGSLATVYVLTAAGQAAYDETEAKAQ